jgi:hypothetical protein
MLDNGASLPEIGALTLEGEKVTVGALAAGSWSVVLFYRGHW